MEAQVEKLTVKKNHVPKTEFIPRHKEFNKRVLQFKLYFKETVFESQLEHYRVRYVDLYYYLEDDTIMLIEPVVENSGIPQGKNFPCLKNTLVHAKKAKPICTAIRPSLKISKVSLHHDKAKLQNLKRLFAPL